MLDIEKSTGTHGCSQISWCQHGQFVVCSDSYHFGRATHICGWLVFNWSSDSKQALWSVSMPMVIMILLPGVPKKGTFGNAGLIIQVSGSHTPTATATRGKPQRAPEGRRRPAQIYLGLTAHSGQLGTLLYKQLSHLPNHCIFVQGGWKKISAQQFKNYHDD